VCCAAGEDPDLPAYDEVVLLVQLAPHLCPRDPLLQLATLRAPDACVLSYAKWSRADLAAETGLNPYDVRKTCDRSKDGDLW
jgi:hypothetical protein